MFDILDQRAIVGKTYRQEAHVKGTLLLLLTLSASVSATSWTDRQNPLFTTGLGFAPIYIEEITQAGQLTTGATVMPLHARVRYGWNLTLPVVMYLSTDNTLYSDADSNLYLISLIGGGLELTLEDVMNTRLSVGAGYADKRIFGAGLNTAGWGLHLGLTQPVSDRMALDIGYLFRQFSSVASRLGDGEQEHSSMLMLGLSYRWQ